MDHLHLQLDHTAAGRLLDGVDVKHGNGGLLVVYVDIVRRDGFTFRLALQEPRLD